MTLTAFTNSSLAFLFAVDVLKPDRTSDGQGGWTKTYAVVSTVTGNIQPLTQRQQREMQTADKETVMITNKAYLPIGTDVAEEDRLSAKGKEYRVVSVMNAGGMDRHLVCDLLEIR